MGQHAFEKQGELFLEIKKEHEPDCNQILALALTNKTNYYGRYIYPLELLFKELRLPKNSELPREEIIAGACYAMLRLYHNDLLQGCDDVTAFTYFNIENDQNCPIFFKDSENSIFKLDINANFKQNKLEVSVDSVMPSIYTFLRFSELHQEIFKYDFKQIFMHEPFRWTYFKIAYSLIYYREIEEYQATFENLENLPVKRQTQIKYLQSVLSIIETQYQDVQPELKSAMCYLALDEVKDEIEKEYETPGTKMINGITSFALFGSVLTPNNSTLWSEINEFYQQEKIEEKCAKYKDHARCFLDEIKKQLNNPDDVKAVNDVPGNIDANELETGLNESSPKVVFN